MHRGNQWIFVAILIIISLVLSACKTDAGNSSKKEKPAVVEAMENGLNKITLTEKAAERTGIEIASVKEERVAKRDGKGKVKKTVVPYSSVIYDIKGDAWVYVNPEPLVFMREPIEIEYIVGGFAIISDGPSLDTEVVSVGAAILLGEDLGVGK